MVKLNGTVKGKRFAIRSYCPIMKKWFPVKCAWRSNKRYADSICWGIRQLETFRQFEIYTQKISRQYFRANGKSFVCDVNGFSFVKNSNKYYDDCAKILGNMILRELAPTLHIPWSVPFQLDDPPIVPTTFGKMMELRCVVAVIRHGDRTPKQKMKVEVRHPK